MLIGLVLLYFAKILEAPIWIFVIIWLEIGLSALSIIIKATEAELKRRQKKKLLDELFEITREQHKDR